MTNNNGPKWNPATGKLIDPDPTRVPSPADNPYHIPSPAERNAEMQLKAAEESKRPAVIEEREALQAQRDENAALESIQKRLDTLTTKLSAATAGKAQAEIIARKTADTYTREVVDTRRSRGYLGLDELLSKFEAELPERLAEIAVARDAVIADERKAASVVQKAAVTREAAGMTDAQTLDWLERQRFRLRRKGDAIQIAPIGGVSLREQVAIRMHYTGLLALLKNREDWGTIDALES